MALRLCRGRAAAFGLRATIASIALAVPLAYAAPGDISSCSNLSKLLISNTSITSAVYVPAAGTVPGYCEVNATVAPQTDITVRMPDVWYQRYLQLGGGGFDGNIPNLASPAMNFNKNPVAYGFAVAGSNGGHRSAAYPGASFAVDRGLSLSYASGKIYDTDVVAKAAISAYYGKPAKYRYFAGCSNGGKNASVAAAVFGDDYDGIVAGDGVYGHNDDNIGGSDMSGMTAKWAASSQATRAVPISAAKGAAVYQAQLAACDAADGVVDGIISNPEACHFNLLSLACSGNGNDACLTGPEIQTIASLRSDLTDANGRVIGAPWGLGDPSQANASSSGLGGGFLALAFGVPSYDINNFSLDRDFGTLKLVLDGVYGMSGSLPGITNYLKKGKKLIIYHGWDDMTVQPYISPRFYSALQKSAGADAANARLYMFPGMQHCRGGVGPDTADLVGAMANWVEGGMPPNDSLVAAKLSATGAVTLTRPLCAYPKVPVYAGGDKSAASSFACVAVNSANSEQADQ
jgi:feruloyl esterase